MRTLAADHRALRNHVHRSERDGIGLGFARGKSTRPPKMEESNINLRPAYGAPPPLPADDARGTSIILAILMVAALVILIFMLVGRVSDPAHPSLDLGEESRSVVP